MECVRPGAALHEPRGSPTLEQQRDRLDLQVVLSAGPDELGFVLRRLGAESR